MKKIIKHRGASAPKEDKPDIAVVISQMREQLISLEKKMDTLLARSPEKPSYVKPFQEKPFQKPFQRFDRPQQHDRGERNNSFRGGERDNNFRERSFTKVTCSDCRKECEVPFKPSGDRPVYCKDCFAKRKESRGEPRENRGDRPNEQVFIPERSNRHFDKNKNSESRKPGKRKHAGSKKRK
jgi:CxxC-x17-CxxC domain-containing protein